MKQDALKQPFFAALLESQKNNPEPEGNGRPPIKPTFPAADHLQTHKYPSDSDEDDTRI